MAGGGEATNIPPWVRVAEDNEALLIPPPAPSIPATRHYKPPNKYTPGRKWDHVRDSEPPLLSMPIEESQARWVDFMHSGPQMNEKEGESNIMSRAWMEENVAGYGGQWKAEDEEDLTADGKIPFGFKGIMYRGEWLISPERQERTVRFIWRLLLKNAFVPLFFRVIILAFSAAAIGVAGTILHKVHLANTDKDQYNQCQPRASTYMGIIVGAVAVPYITYVTYDEYFSKPLGLRSVAAKTALLLCDLYFIVFASSNLSLAFSVLRDDSWACYDRTSDPINGVKLTIGQTCPNNSDICTRQKSLTGVLLVSLVAWLLCFSISVLRVVEKLRMDKY